MEILKAHGKVPMHDTMISIHYMTPSRPARVFEDGKAATNAFISGHKKSAQRKEWK